MNDEKERNESCIRLNSYSSNRMCNIKDDKEYNLSIIRVKNSEEEYNNLR